MDMSIFDFEHSLDGMRRALEEEQKFSSRCKCDAIRLELAGPLAILTLRAKLPAEFLEVKEGWLVRGKYKNGDYWCAEIIDIDRHYPPTIVLNNNLQEPLKEDIESQCKFYETDFLFETKNWLKRKRNTSDPSLPTGYTKLVRSPVVIPEGEAAATDQEEFHDGINLREAQRKAVSLVKQPFGVVWGPPGTGKTYTLGALVNRLRSEPGCILVMAPTNVAADCAVLAINNAANMSGKPLKAGELIRPGFPQLSELESMPNLMAWNEPLESMRHNLLHSATERKKWEDKRKQKTGKDRKHLQQALATHKLAERNIKIDRSRILWTAASDAKIVVTTLHSAMNNEEELSKIHGQELNIVLDEAGMIPRFMLARLMDLAPHKLYFFGDFKQLGPVRANKNKEDQNSIKWIANSAFTAVGLNTAEDAKRMEENGALAMLTQQSRMRKELCEKVSEVFYAGKLKTISPQPPKFTLRNQPENGIVIVDPDEWASILQNKMINLPETDKLKNHCPSSILTAVGIGSAILEADKSADVMLLTPFRNQANALTRYSNSCMFSHEGRWKAGTVHLSQGQESDFVIFSPVNPSHTWLTGGYGPEDLERLLCVAFSRARTQVIVVARPHTIPKSPLLSSLCSDAPLWTPS